MPIHLTCPACGRAFDRFRSAMRGRTASCSPACAAASRRLNVAAPIIEGDIARVPLRARDGTVRAYAIIDAADAEFVGQWSWHLRTDGYVSRKITIEGLGQRDAFLHRELMGLRYGDTLEVDHINRQRTDDRRSNLRIVSYVEQTHNRSSTRGSSSHYRGVCWSRKYGKWHAQIQVNGRGKHLGYFVDELEAAAAARAARLKLLPGAID